MQITSGKSFLSSDSLMASVFLMLSAPVREFFQDLCALLSFDLRSSLWQIINKTNTFFGTP